MSELNPFYDYRKRGYLLPPGCKDLIDVLKCPAPYVEKSRLQFQTDDEPTGEFLGEIAIPDEIMVRELARLVGQKPFRIIALLMKWGVFATPQQSIDFKTASTVLRYFGYVPLKVV
ncbi:MAG: Translation initiation factor [Pedosphaera sp.]|nr:Translation initiation factor [Pedosphaera sp.]